MQFDPHTPLAGERLRPLGHLSSYQLCHYNTVHDECPVFFAIFLKIFENTTCCTAKGNKNGEGGIRTHGTRQEFNGFQDRLLKPLGHPSKAKYIVAGICAAVKGKPCRKAAVCFCLSEKLDKNNRKILYFSVNSFIIILEVYLVWGYRHKCYCR